MLKAWGLTWGGWLDNRRGEWWLLAQLVLIAAHLAPPWPQSTPLEGSGWLQARVLIGAIMLAVGLMLALQSFLDLGDSLSPLPAVRDEHRLIVSGAYQRCRHPLYQALLCCSVGVGLARGSWLHLALLIALGAVLGGKARFEERDLRRRYPDYADYAATTPAIVPRLPWLDWVSC